MLEDENSDKSEDEEDTPRVTADYGGRRKILDRRKSQIPIDHPDRRSGKERRSGFDRRSAFNERPKSKS